MARSRTTFAKGQAATAGTRRGNGAGWGGAAKGEGNKGAGPGKPKGLVEAKRTVADLMVAEGGRELAAERWLAILNDPTHPKHADMVAKAADRMDGAPTARVEIADGDPATMTDEQLAAIASRGRRGAASTADDPA